MSSQSLAYSFVELLEIGESLLDLHGPAAQAVIVLDDGMPAADDVIPTGYREGDAPWLGWALRARLLLRSRTSASGAEQRVPAEGGRELVAMTLRVADIHLGALVAEVPPGAPTPWSPMTAGRIAFGLARSLAPRLHAAWAAQLSAQQRTSLFQLALERLGGGTSDVALVRATDEGASPAFRGAVRLPGSERSASYFGRVGGSPCPSSLATLVASCVRRWLTELPEPDPATIVDAVHTDNAALLEHFDAWVDLAVLVPRSGTVMAIATTGPPLVALDHEGSARGGAQHTGPPLRGGVLSARDSERLTLPRGGYVLGADGVALRDLVRFTRERGLGPRAVTSVATSARDLIVAHTGEQPATVLAHELR